MAQNNFMDDLLQMLRPTTTSTATPIAPPAINAPAPAPSLLPGGSPPTAPEGPGIFDRFKTFIGTPQGQAFMQSAGQSLAGVPQGGTFLTRANSAVGSGFDAIARQSTLRAKAAQQTFDNQQKIDQGRRDQQRVDVERGGLVARRSEGAEKIRSNKAGEVFEGQRVEISRATAVVALRRAQTAAAAERSTQVQRGFENRANLLNDSATRAMAEYKAAIEVAIVNGEDKVEFNYSQALARNLEVGFSSHSPEDILQMTPAMSRLGVTKSELDRILWMARKRITHGWSANEAARVYQQKADREDRIAAGASRTIPGATENINLDDTKKALPEIPTTVSQEPSISNELPERSRASLLKERRRLTRLPGGRTSENQERIDAITAELNGRRK